MKSGFVDILKGKFLTGGEAAGKNWRFMVFISVLAVIMISSSHSADEKVNEIARLTEGLQELRNEYVQTRSNLQLMKLESKVKNVVAEMELHPSENPPKKIKITTME